MAFTMKRASAFAARSANAARLGARNMSSGARGGARTAARASAAAGTFAGVLVMGSGGALCLSWPGSKPKTVVNGVDYQAVYNDIASVLEDLDYDDGSYGPVFVRLAWHAAGTYSKADGTGGSDGSTMRFNKEASWGANAGLAVARKRLEAIKAKYPGLSYADLWSLSGVVAIQEMGGPVIPWRPGRTDAADDSRTPPDGRLPDASKGTPHLRDIFHRMGFSDQEIVALSGAHALGRCHTDRSGYHGPWTNAPTTFSNLYYKALKEETWVPKKQHVDAAGKPVPWKGPLQYTDAKTGTLMMLPSDMALVQTPDFAQWVDKYAADQTAFFADFAVAFSRLQELGVKAFQSKEAVQPLKLAKAH